MSKRIIGLDLGVATCGWGFIKVGDSEGEVLGTGSYCFNAPIVGGKSQNKFASLNAAKRLQTRAMRRIRRKRSRMNALRRLLFASGLLSNPGQDALANAYRDVSPPGRKPQITPFDLRAEALNRLLSKHELAVVIGHLLSHPGFRSAAKRLQRPNEEKEYGKVLAGVQAMGGYATRGYLTVGEMLARDPAFRVRKRNRAGNYTQTVGRADVEYELREIFRRQIGFGSACASDDLCNAVMEIVNRKAEPKFDYYPVGDCRFEREEKRAALHSYSFELFRVLDKLVKLEINRNGPLHPTPDELVKAIADFGNQPSISFADLRTIWALPSDANFSAVASSEETHRDIATAKGECAFGTHRLRAVIGESAWSELIATPDVLDKIAWILSFSAKTKVAETSLEGLGLGLPILENIKQAIHDGEFDQFSRAGHFSAKSARNLIAHLRNGEVYSKACELAGYKHSAPSVGNTRNSNQVTKRAVEECLLLLEEIINENGMPDRICIELGRDVGKSADMRAEIEEEIKKATSRLNKVKAEYKECYDHSPNDWEFLAFRLARDQGWKCIYSGKDIPRDSVRSGKDSIQIDHILPRSRFGIMRDYNNFVVCLKGENQNKLNKTPYEWLRDSERWPFFVAQVASCKELPKRKRRFLLLQDAEKLENGFMRRSLADSQIAARLVMGSITEFLHQKFPDIIKLPEIVARPARLVSWLRRGWELDHIKYLNGQRTSDDRHHAIDALVIAAIDNRTLNLAIRAAQANEISGRPRFEFSLPKPWATFSEDVKRAVENIPLVARAVNTDFGGRIHEDTANSLNGDASDKFVEERKPVTNLKIEDLLRIKNPERNHRLVELLRQWIVNGKPKDALPAWKYRWPDGTETWEQIKKVRLISNKPPAVTPSRVTKINKDTGIEEPFASFGRGEMDRVDVFRKADKKQFEYFLVPIYPHQINNNRQFPSAPNRAIVAHKDETHWEIIDDTFEFQFSISINDYIEVAKNSNETIAGYFKGVDRDGGQITICQHNDLSLKLGRPGSRKLASFKKFTVDRLGRKFEVSREVRTWRGKACT